MNTDYNPDKLHIIPQLCVSGFRGSVSYRSGDMRSVILSGNAASISQAIQESIDHTFGKDSLEAQSESDERA
jgi:hypothetical protein